MSQGARNLCATRRGVALEDEDAADVLATAYCDEGELGSHEYNASTLVCLPKAHTGEDPDLSQCFNPWRHKAIVHC